MAADDINTKDDDDDLFGDDDGSDGEDTDDLIAAASAKQGPPSIAHSKTIKKVSATTSRSAADFDDNDDDDDSDDDAAGLFDSSDEDDDAGPTKKKKVKSKKLLGGGKNKGKKLFVGGSNKTEKRDSSSSTTADATKTQPKTMKERMEALANKKRIAGGVKDTSEGAEPKKKRSKNSTTTNATAANGVEKNTNDDEESVNSAEFVRTKEDDDFIDSDDDSVARKELYAEQHFDDEENSDMEEKTKKKKNTAAATAAGKGGRKSGGGGGIDKISLSDDEDANNPNDATNALKAAVRNMSKSKKKLPGLADLEEEGNAFLRQMEDAADADDKCIAAKTPAFNKLAMLPTVLSMLVRKRPETGKDGTSMVRVLLDNDLLSYCKRWVQPLPNGTLGNVTLRRGIIDCVATMTGELGVQTSDLKRSGFGRTVMTLYRHKNETQEMKKILKGMIEQWSRPIFQKSGNLRDLEGAQQQQQQYGMGGNDNSLVGLARARHLEARREEEERSSATATSSRAGGGGTRGGAKMESSGRGRTEDDLERIIAKGAEAARDLGNNRVRIPYSKGFQYSIRPESRHGNVSDSRNLISGRKAEGRNSAGGSNGGGGGGIMDEKRGALSKRMEAKSRKTNKSTQRSANVSVEGRVVK